MSSSARRPKPHASGPPRRGKPGRGPPLQRGFAGVAKAPQGRAQQKSGAYKRVEVFLGVDAAIALRALMRDGRSAREVIEALLIAERRRRKPRGADARTTTAAAPDPSAGHGW